MFQLILDTEIHKVSIILLTKFRHARIIGKFHQKINQVSVLISCYVYPIVPTFIHPTEISMYQWAGASGTQYKDAGLMLKLECKGVKDVVNLSSFIGLMMGVFHLQSF